MRTLLDLFSGVGGFSLAARWAGGIETIGFAEIDEYCSKILEKHWPGVPNYGDARTIPCDELAGRVWLLSGGVPCQPASLAGKRRGAKDDRWLWPEALRIVGLVKPTWVLFENVPGFIALDGGVELERVLSDLEGKGYAAWPVVVPACAVDARHRRDRIWIVANRDCGSRGTEPWQQQGQRAEVAYRSRKKDVANTSSGGTQPEKQQRQCDELRGGGEALSDASVPRLEKRGEQSAREEREATQRSGEALGDTAEKGVRRAGTPGNGRHALQPGGRQPQSELRRMASRLPEGLDRAARWPEEWEGVPRISKGVKNRVNRLKALGNSIVPQIAEKFIRWMREAEEQGEVK